MRRHLLTILLVAFCAGLPLNAQTDYEIWARRSPWASSSNSAGLRMDSLSVAFASVGGGYEFGPFRASYEPESTWNAGLTSSAVVRHERMSLMGGFSFRHSTGYNSCGSMFLSHGRYPFDVAEFTPGTKHTQAYRLFGAVGIDLTEAWKIGASLDYNASNYKKIKDLRHANHVLDMDASLSAMYREGDWSLGLSFLAGKDSETINAETVGSLVASYDALLDKGLGYGAFEAWSGSGVHLDDSGVSGFPVNESSYGAAVTGAWKDLVAELSWTYSRGKAGEKKQIWFEFPKDRLVLDIFWHAVDGRGLRHGIRGGLHLDSVVNSENVLEQMKEGGVTTTVKIGSNRIYSQKNFGTDIVYELSRDRRYLLVESGFRLDSRQGTLVYPWVCTEHLTLYSIKASGRMAFGPVDVMASAGMRLRLGWEGGMEPVATAPAGMEFSVPSGYRDLHEANLLWRGRNMIHGMLGARYNFRFGMYVGLSWESENVRRGIFGRNRAGIDIGYNF